MDHFGSSQNDVNLAAKDSYLHCGLYVNNENAIILWFSRLNVYQSSVYSVFDRKIYGREIENEHSEKM